MTDYEKTIMDKYDKILSMVEDEIKNKFENRIKKRTESIQKPLSILLKLHTFTQYLFKKIYPIENHELRFILLEFAMKSSETVYSIYLTLNNFLTRDASTLLRTLIELYFNLALILEKDTDERLKLYFDYRIVFGYRNSIEKNRKVKDVSNERIIEMYESVKTNFKPKKPNSWCWKIFQDKIKNGNDPTLYDIAKHLGEYHLHLYNSVYFALSVTVHSSTPGHTNYYKIGYSIISITIDIYEHIYKLLVSYYKIDDYEEITLYLDNFNNELLN
jgi:hypothetical protein